MQGNADKRILNSENKGKFYNFDKVLKKADTNIIIDKLTVLGFP